MRQFEEQFTDNCNDQRVMSKLLSFSFIKVMNISSYVVQGFFKKEKGRIKCYSTRRPDLVRMGAPVLYTKVDFYT